MPEVTSLLADTHVWWRWRNQPSKLTKSQARAIAAAERRNQAIAVSAISLWELAQMASRGKVSVKGSLEAWLEEMAGHPLIEVLPITAQIAAAAMHLGGAPSDPADTIIIATARCHNLKLLTSDQRIVKWGGVHVI